MFRALESWEILECFMNVKLVCCPDVTDEDQGLGVTCIVWGYETLYLLTGALSSSSIFLDGGILEQYEEEEHTAFRSTLFFTASQMQRGEAELVHLQLSKLLKSILYSYRHEFWNEKTSKCGNDKERQTYQCWTARLPFVISLSVWSLDSEILRNPSSIFALSLNWKVAIKSAGQDTVLPNAVQADRALSFLEISYRPLNAAVLNLPEKR